MPKRLFLAIPLSEEIKKIVADKRNAIDPELKWIPLENLHITLHFFGSIEEEAIPLLIHKLSAVIRSYPAFRLYTKEIGSQSGKFQRMVWVKFEKADEFVELSTAIAKTLGISLSRKPIAHINLIRIKDKKKSLNNTVLPMILNEEIKVDHVELWESGLRPGKFPEYRSLHRFILK